MTDRLTNEDVSLMREITKAMLTTIYEEQPDRQKRTYPAMVLSLLYEVERLREEAASKPCPECGGEGGEYFTEGQCLSEWHECNFCRGEKHMTVTEAAVRREQLDSEYHLYGIVGPLQDEVERLREERDRYRDALVEIANGLAACNGEAATELARKALEAEDG